MNVLSAENISKSYGIKSLFNDISFTISDTDKVGVIGINGTGKSTLLKVIAGYEPVDSGTITIPNGVTLEYLSQNPNFNLDITVLEQVFKGDSPNMIVIRDYERALEDSIKNPNDEKIQDRLIKLTDDMNKLNAWELESQAKAILTKLGITEFDKKIHTLSGGQKKRIALASALITPCDLLILDEPTNHMDSDTIDWLEKYLENRKGALIMITHDRYFLDRVVNKTLELDCGKLYTYTGNYSQFLEKKLERQALESTMEHKRQRLYKKELEWIRTGARARTTKQKARIQRFEEIKNSKVEVNDSTLDISVSGSRLGQKIIEIKNLSKSFDEKVFIKDFTYTFLKDDRIGVIGNSGIGKSTLLNIIVGKIEADSGSVDIGSTVNIAYFSQESQDMNPNLRAIEYIKESGEFVTTADGTKISASQMMERFLFTSDMQWSYISKLSGGERRRLYLLKVLMTSPNVLILDEPTNDLDLDTLKVLENYIHEFSGPVITVSHDRYFLDVICNKILSFENDGNIIMNVGNHSDFVDKRDLLVSNVNSSKNNNVSKDTSEEKEASKEYKSKSKKTKFTYNEQREYEKIDSEIEALEKEIDKIDNEMELYSSDFTKLQELLERKEKIEEEYLFKLERQEYFVNLESEIKNNLLSSRS
ncbi:ABC transporter ATP-binding protein [Gottschalkia acidurici 9a]|uniref:ABC transporter ATP-binding protein n=1 Tax=Gottschalkia acidurici (strain ATCC 7906 / DSM 604 / BCRC 14475 / CIP 104303 / KCTC 5404 / NCIMB 10678 / 9a) TaxID=1128398 RepID=K0B517_GOTA9|nr:ABC-F family ATP-binding cassette domain-containing protein [Gottschalkia acidurici]AFS79656.1 ABC transporter ATP-binding protein [Gottschalkia acidurici 9a]